MKAILAVIALAIFTATTADASQRATAPSKEVLLVQSGFKLVTVTTPKQKEAVNGLAQGRCSAVQYNGKLFYVFPAATKDKIYVGKQAQFNAYKKAIQAQGSRRIVTVEQPPPRTKPVQPVEPQKNDNDQRTVEVPPPPPPKQHREVKTDCMLVATENYHRLQTVAVWARILAFKFQINGTVIKEGHAVAVWQVNEGGKVYAIDSRGTLELDTTSQKESDVLSALGMKYSEGSGYSFVLVGHFAD